MIEFDKPLAIDLDTPVEGFPFQYSQSRYSTLCICPRKYFYSYYLAALDPNVLRLKKLSDRRLWPGTVVHDFIEAFLRTNDSIPRPEAQEDLIRQLTHGQMKQDWMFSQAGTKKFRLWEHEYGVTLTDFEKKVIVGTVAFAVREFFKSEILAEAMVVGRKNWLTIEDMFELEIEGVKCMGAMDFAYRRADGSVRIVDWKTGRKESEDYQHQVNTYGLFAEMKGWAKIQDITTTLAYLVIPKVVDAQCGSLDGTREYIRNATARMRSFLFDEQKNTALMGEFSQCNKEKLCEGCPYRRLCWPNWEQAAPKIRALREKEKRMRDRLT